MERPTPLSRRTLVTTTTGAAFTALFAGCLEGDEDDEDTLEDTGPLDGEEPAEEIGEEEWRDAEEFTFEARAMSGWIGVEPAFLEDEENPEIVLFEDQTYDFTLVNHDDTEHNFEIRDHDPGEVDDPETEHEPIDDYETEIVSEEDETWSLEDVEPTSEMAGYVCEVHPDIMYGGIEVRT